MGGTGRAGVPVVDGGQLLAIAGDRARSVRLHIVDVGRIDAGTPADLQPDLAHWLGNRGPGCGIATLQKFYR